MKLRDLPRALWAARVPHEYEAVVTVFHLPVDGDVAFARWLHPGESPKTVTQSSVDALRAFLRPGDVAIDIGAHTGDSTLPIALAVGPSGIVYAFEPNPYVFKVLAVNATLNPSKAQIVPLMCAAMPEDGEFTFQYSDNGYCNGGFHPSISRWRHGDFFRLPVRGMNVLNYLQTSAPEALARLRYIKIDTEGFDREVAASLADALRAVRPYVKTEIYKHLPGRERTGYFDDLRGLGYRVFKCEESRYRGQEVSRQDMSRWPHFDIFAVPEELE